MNCNNDCNQGRDCTCHPIRPTDEQIEQWQAQDRADLIAAAVAIGCILLAIAVVLARMVGLF